MQPKPKKCNRSLPKGWDEEDTKKQMIQVCIDLFGGYTKNGVIKVTPKVSEERETK